MFVKNSFEYDARVTKEAKTLIAAGHEVTVVAIHVPEVTAQDEVTADGVAVVRVSRLQFGVGAVNRVAARWSSTAEVRRSRLTGEPLDANRARSMSVVVPASTATPGDARQVQLPEVGVPTQPGLVTRWWGRTSSAILRAMFETLRFGVRSLRFLLGRQGRVLKTWAINRRMIEVGLSTGADVFHSHDLNTLYVGHICKQRTGAKLVYDSHELATERNRMGRSWKAWATWNERKWLPSADALIVASPSWINHLRVKHGSIPEISETVINVPEVNEAIEPRDLHAKLSLPAHAPIMVYQGSIQENRGIEPAIEAVQQLDGVVLVIIGYGYHRPTLEEMVRKRKLTDQVYFFGPVPNRELLEYTASADIGLCNIVNSSLSYHTSLPNKLFEYIAAGVPVIGSDSPEIGRIVKETGVGEVCDPVDPEALAAAARKLLAQPDDYRRATGRAATRYQWAVEEKNLLSVYEALLR